jgi:ribonuclease HI
MIQFQLEQGSHQSIISPPPIIFRESDTIHAFTDGACGKDGFGGWACAIQWNDKLKIKFGSAEKVTSNIMELTGILVAVKSLKPKDSTPAIIYTDSQYCQKAITLWVKGWKRAGWITAQGTAVKNKELIEEIDDRVREAKKTRSLYIQWVKGHLDNSTHVAHQYNCMVDDIAVQAKKKRITNIVLE